MKLKHWQGYGTINAKVLSKKQDTVVIEVWGNHECGLRREGDKYGVEKWLGGIGRFGDRRVQAYEMNDFCAHRTAAGIEEDHCIYTIHLVGKKED